MILAIVGPTASGKTAVSLEVASLLGGSEAVEIISADAFQLYRGMDIGTAKLPVAQRRGISHHQVDVLELSQAASVASFQREARGDLESILGRGKIPLVVGGSGLYVSALVDELDFPGTDPRVRAEVEAEAAEDFPRIVEELRREDPRAYEVMDLKNERRVIRAVEIIRLTGQYTARFPRHTSHYPGVALHALRREREVLDEAIAQRARQMFVGGLLEEVESLLGSGLRKAPTAARATGYAQALQVLDGQITLDKAVESTALSTRRLARKQMKWFRADPRVIWHDLTDGDVSRVAREIVADCG